MITIPRKKVAIIPVFDSSETHGGIIKPSSFVAKRKVAVYEILDVRNGRKVEETDDPEMVNKYILRYARAGITVRARKKTIEQDDQFLDSGERCDQGVVKYIGREVTEVQIGDYVFFSGYSGTLMDIEGEGKLILLPESFIECTFDIDKFMTIPGLYFRSTTGLSATYFEVTYEKAMEIIAQSFTELGKTIEVKTKAPKLEDYNVK